MTVPSISRTVRLHLVVACMAGWLACDSPPPPLDVTNPPGTFIESFVDFGDVSLGTTQVEHLNLEPGSKVSSPAVVHLALEDLAGDTASDPAEFSIALDGGTLTAPCVIAITFAPTHVAAQNKALLAFWFTAPDGGIIDRSGYVLRATSVPPGALDAGPDAGLDAG